MAVAVISSTGKVLMPTSEYRARKLLKSGRGLPARLKRRMGYPAHKKMRSEIYFENGGKCMEILNISKKDKEVVLALTADELVRLCNVLYVQEKYDDNLHHKLYGDLMIARDLCQYGHIDGFCFERIAECRSKIK